jgi:hypothetical protein
VASTTQITLAPSANGVPPFTGTFTLTASGGPVAFTITAPPGLSVIPSSGSLTAGQSITVTVTASSPPPPGSVLTLNPGGATVTVLAPPLT